MLGEPGTEQFTIETWHDAKLIRAQRIHDPFIHSTTTIALSRWELFKALFRKQFITRIRVNIRKSNSSKDLLQPEGQPMSGLDSLIAEFQAFAESVGHQQTEDPAEGMVATESCVHCQLILLFIPKLEVYAAAERALREKLEGLAEKWENEERFQLSIDGRKYAEQLREQLKGS